MFWNSKTPFSLSEIKHEHKGMNRLQKIYENETI